MLGFERKTNDGLDDAKIVMKGSIGIRNGGGKSRFWTPS